MIEDFGTTSAGHSVQAVTISAGKLTARLLTLGAVLQSLRLSGVDHDLTIGSASLADYEGAFRHHGSIIGPVANRITGATSVICGKSFDFEANQDGHITLHSGQAGTHLKVWDLVEHGQSHVIFALNLPDGEGGFPGNRRVTARFDIAAPAGLRLTLNVTTDAPTLINFANHSYWNLDGSADYSGHSLRIAADRYLPTTPAATPQGPIAGVEGSAVDFRQPRRLEPGQPALDLNFCLSDRRAPLRDVLWLRGALGVTLTMATTEPGLQVFDNHPQYRGLALEAQFWPDAPNHRAYPSIELAPGGNWQQQTEWRFARDLPP